MLFLILTFVFYFVICILDIDSYVHTTSFEITHLCFRLDEGVGVPPTTISLGKTSETTTHVLLSTWMWLVCQSDKTMVYAFTYLIDLISSFRGHH